MKIAFLIDKAQTFQIIIKLLKVSLERSHKCHLFCCFDRSMLSENLIDYFGEDLGRITWITNSDRNSLVRLVCKNRHNFDCVLGINFFNRSLASIYENSTKSSYGFEYYWNELYNQKKNLKIGSTPS